MSAWGHPLIARNTAAMHRRPASRRALSPQALRTTRIVDRLHEPVIRIVYSTWLPFDNKN